MLKNSSVKKSELKPKSVGRIRARIFYFLGSKIRVRMGGNARASSAGWGKHENKEPRTFPLGCPCG